MLSFSNLSCFQFLWFAHAQNIYLHTICSSFEIIIGTIITCLDTPANFSTLTILSEISSRFRLTSATDYIRFISLYEQKEFGDKLRITQHKISFFFHLSNVVVIESSLVADEFTLLRNIERGIGWHLKCKMIGRFSLAVAVLMLVAACSHGAEMDNKARYDNYRLYRLLLATSEHVQIFQEIEERSDSYSFIGHAREVGQKLIVLVAAHKVAECADILNRYKVGHEVLVSK